MHRAEPIATTARRATPRPGRPLLRHLCCVLLVVAFVHLYQLYRLVDELFGPGFLALAPLVLPPAMLLLALFLARRNRGRAPFKAWVVVSGMALCLAALAVPDADIAIKRIHVAQYLLLSLAVRHALAVNTRGVELTVAGSLLGGLYGVHDELLQGLHPDRTYGLRDMLVNFLAASGGSLAWHGLGLFDGSRQPPPAAAGPRLGWVAPLALAVTVTAMAVPLSACRGQATLPWWPVLPLAALLAAGALETFGQGRRPCPPCLPLMTVAALFLLYPLAVNVLQIPFY